MVQQAGLAEDMGFVPSSHIWGLPPPRIAVPENPKLSSGSEDTQSTFLKKYFHFLKMKKL